MNVFDRKAIELTTHTMHEILACAKFNIEVAKIKMACENIYLRMLYSVLSMTFSLLNSQRSILDLGLPVLNNHSFLSTETQKILVRYHNNYKHSTLIIYLSFLKYTLGILGRGNQPQGWEIPVLPHLMATL